MTQKAEPKSKTGRKLALSKETIKDLTAKAGQANQLQVKGGRWQCTGAESGCAGG